MPANGAGKRRRNPKVTDGPEDKLQISVAALLAVALLPPAVWTAFPAGMYALERAAGGRLKAYGLKPGMPDIQCLHDGRVVFIELKRIAGTVSRVQHATHEELERAGFHVYICRTPEAVIDALHREGFPVRREFTKQLLDRPFEPAERQVIGDLYFGAIHTGATQGSPAKSPESPATSP